MKKNPFNKHSINNNKHCQILKCIRISKKDSFFTDSKASVHKVIKYNVFHIYVKYYK